ncbi:MAG TPA: EF-hand domain-containing protein [Sphingomicrobium sp.]
MFKRLTAVSILTAMPALALAQEPTATEQPKPLARSEISTQLDTDYADMDANKDGKVTPVEINTRLVKSAEAKIEEMKKERDAAFGRLDSNSDGSISRAEFDARAKLPTIKDPDAKPFLDQFDANKDGAISKDEFRAPTLANFDRLDANKDGTLTPAERVAAASASATTPAKKPAVKQTPSIGR